MRSNNRLDDSIVWELVVQWLRNESVTQSDRVIHKDTHSTELIIHMPINTTFRRHVRVREPLSGSQPHGEITGRCAIRSTYVNLWHFFFPRSQVPSLDGIVGDSVIISWQDELTNLELGIGERAVRDTSVGGAVESTVRYVLAPTQMWVWR